MNHAFQQFFYLLQEITARNRKKPIDCSDAVKSSTLSTYNEKWWPPVNLCLHRKYILLRVIPNRICENDRELRMVAHWFAEEMTRARISTVWDKWPQA